MTSSAIAASEKKSSAAAPGLLHVFPGLRAGAQGDPRHGLDEAPAPEDLYQRLSDQPDLTALVIYASPAVMLCAHADQTDPRGVLDALRSWADSVLPILRAFRRRVRLLDAALIARAPRDAAGAAGLPADTLQAVISGVRGADAEPLLLAAAKAIVDEDARASRAFEELEASAIHGDPPATGVSTSVEVFAGVHRQGVQLAAVERACERAHEERSALIERAESLNAAIAALEADLEAARAEAGESAARAGTLKAELEAVRIELKAMTAERDDLVARLARVELWMHLTRSSFSYRIMQPLRKVRALFGRSDPLAPVDRSETSE